MKFLPFSKDRWLSKEGSIIPYDKLEHFLIALIGVISIQLSFTYLLLTPSPIVVFLFGSLAHICMFVRLLGISRELWDSVVPYSMSPRQVQGWSWKDLIANEAGIHTAVQILLFIQGA